MIAVTLTNWEDVNSYFEDGWEYVDSKIISVKKDEFAYYFILQRPKELEPIQMVKVN